MRTHLLHRGRGCAAAFGLAAALITICALGLRGPVAPAHARGTGTAAVRTCTAGDLRLSLGPAIVPMTGEHGDLVVLSDRTPRACSVDGFPGVALLRGGRRLGFHTRHGGLGYVPRLRPRSVELSAGHRGYVLVAAYRCDVKGEIAATAAKLSLPRTSGAITVTLSRPYASQIDFCLHPETSPPNELAITPIEPSRARAETPPTPMRR